MSVAEWIPKGLVDPYDRTARLYPGLLVVLPISVVVICLYGSGHPWATSSVSALGFCGVGYAIGRLARDAGKQRQESLFAKWGGSPTTQLLRHRDTTFDPLTKQRYHAYLGSGVQMGLPTVEQENSDPAAADLAYRAATVWLISRTRNTKTFPLVFKENIAFGFQRNSLGVRHLGIVAAAMCMLWVLAHGHQVNGAKPFLHLDLERLSGSETLALAISGLALLYWVFYVGEGAARRTAFAYAERLVQSCDELQPKPQGRGRKKQMPK
jgi:hypothetical protein